MAPRVCLDGCGKSPPPRDSIPGPSSSQQVAILVELSWLNTYKGKPKCGNAGVGAPLIPELCTPASLLPKEITTVGHRTRGWLGPRASPGH